MQITDIGPSSLDPSNATAKLGAGSRLGVLTGLVILALIAAAFTSLATWSVGDPSLSHANGRSAVNWLGFPGAVFADLTMQFLGLASAIALIPPSIWGWWKLLVETVAAANWRFQATFLVMALCHCCQQRGICQPAHT